MLKIKVGVLFGGKSTENEVSVISGLQAAAALDSQKYEPVLIYLSKQGVWYCGEALKNLDEYKDINSLLKKCQRVILSQNSGEGVLLFPDTASRFKKAHEEKIDVFLPVLHGSHGEDGCVQGLLELTDVPFAGSGVLGSALGMDKIAMKAVLRAEGIPVVPYQWFYAHEWEDNADEVLNFLEEKLTYPVIVKPADLGSSIGITGAHDRQELQKAIDLACVFSERIIVEKMISPLREINCAVLGSAYKMRCSLCEEPVRAEEILSFSDKYLQGDAKGMSGLKRRIPAEISEETKHKIETAAMASFRALNCCGVARIDFLLDEQDNVIVNEVNTIPGSLSFYLWEPTGTDFTSLCDELIELALEKKRRKEKRTYSFASDILAQKGFKGKK